MTSTPVSPCVPRARTGCDLQRVNEVADAVRDFGARYLDRVYTQREQAAYAVGGAPSLAARFAAKEAVLKLLGATDGIDLRAIEIRTPRGGGRPAVHLTGPAADLARSLGIASDDDIDVSLSHTGDLALAVAVSYGHPTAGPTGEHPR